MRLPLAALVALGCSATPDLSLSIFLPDNDRSFLSSVSRLNLTARRDDVVLAQSSYSPSESYVSVSGVSHGARTVITLEGVDSSSDVTARGLTCPIDFERAGQSAPLYFSPTNYFAATRGTPLAVRQRPVALALSGGQVLISGGFDGTNLLSSSELFTPGSAVFNSGSALMTARWRAEAISLGSIGLLIVGGSDANQDALAAGELYLESSQKFVPVSDSKLDARVGHRMVVLPDGRAFVSGGSARQDGTPLQTTLFIYVLSGGSYQVSQGPALVEARREHAATVAIGVPVLFGGYGASGILDSIEAVDPDGVSAVIAHLSFARAGATASPLSDGSILLVGGIGSDGKARADAELFNPITRTTTVYSMAQARSGHTATLLTDRRVLVAGGFDDSGSALSSVELFASGVGFLTERSLKSARGGHVAVPLCDSTVLVVGGVSGAELYAEPAN